MYSLYTSFCSHTNYFEHIWYIESHEWATIKECIIYTTKIDHMYDVKVWKRTCIIRSPFYNSRGLPYGLSFNKLLRRFWPYSWSTQSRDDVFNDIKVSVTKHDNRKCETSGQNRVWVNKWNIQWICLTVSRTGLRQAGTRTFNNKLCDTRKQTTFTSLHTCHV